MKKLLWSLLLVTLPVVAYCADGDVFTVQTVEGVTLKMKVISEQAKACQVGIGEIDEEGVIWGSSSDYFVTIPSSANGYTVTKIGDDAFMAVSSDIKGVSIPNTITSIGARAFDNCNFLQSVELPNSVTEIGILAFWACQELKSFKLSSQLTSIPDYFLGYTMLESIELPAGIVSIGREAFASTKLTSVVLPDGLKSIGKEAFSFCGNLTSVSIPASVTEIDDAAFMATALSDVPRMDGMTYLPNSIFHQCGRMRNVTVPANITELRGAVFNLCGELETVNLLGDVTLIGSACFLSDEKLKSINIPQSVTKIEEKAFWRCLSLTSIELPNKLETIGEEAFYGCTGLTSIVIPNSVTWLADGAFEDCSNLSSVKMSESVEHLWPRLFKGCTSLKTCVLPDAVTEIESLVFQECGLTSIQIPKKVHFFQGQSISHTPLESISVAEENTTFDSRGNCNAVIETATNTLIKGCKNTVIPSSVTTIGYNAFQWCDGLTVANIPEGVTTLQSCAYDQCLDLQDVYLPSTLTTIEDGAFQVFEMEEEGWYAKLRSITAKMMTPPVISEYAFKKYEGVTLYVPAGTEELYRQAPNWSKFNIQTAGINELQGTTDATVKNRYLLDGRQTDKANGIVIVRMSDGSVKKVMSADN